MKARHIFFCLMVSALLAQIMPPSNAQYGQGSSAQGQYGQKKVGRKTPESEFDKQQLKGPVDLPNLPPYTGKARFVDGWVLPNMKGGASYHFHYIAEEPKERVVDWYRNTLRTYGWRLEQETGTIIAHGKDYSMCMVSVDKFRPPKEPSFITLIYRKANPNR